MENLNGKEYENNIYAHICVHIILMEKNMKRMCIIWLPWWLSGKASTCQSRRPRFNPWIRKIPGEGNGSLLQ